MSYKCFIWDQLNTKRPIVGKTILFVYATQEHQMIVRVVINKYMVQVERNWKLIQISNYESKIVEYFNKDIVQT